MSAENLNEELRGDWNIAREEVMMEEESRSFQGSGDSSSSHLQIHVRLLPRVVTAQRHLQVGLPSQFPFCSPPPSGRTSQRCYGGAERV